MRSMGIPFLPSIHALFVVAGIYLLWLCGALACPAWCYSPRGRYIY
jgi:hypothetical protein